jgi:hypothetical protein
MVHGGLLFAGSSGTWGGATATFDPDAHATVACRAYLVTVEQFADVVAQETRRPPGGDLAVTLASALPDVDSTYALGPGRYETVVRLGTRDGASLLTVTAAQVGPPDLAAPSEGYLRWVAHGLREAHGWPARRVAVYLASAPGARGVWTREAVEALLRAGPP